MPPKKAKGKGGSTAGKAGDKKKPQKPKPKRQLHPGEVVRKPQGASHGEVTRVGDKLFG